MSEQFQRLEELSQILDKRYMTLNRAKMICDLLNCYKRKPQKIVEVGTYCGTGAIMLGAMVEPWGGHVTTIDLPWTGSPNDHFTKNVDDWIKELGVKNVTAIRRSDGAEGWFKEYLENRSKEEFLDFVYIDGGHTWVNTVSQFILAYSSIKHGGWLCFDDVENDKWPDVSLVWKNVVLKSGIGQYHRVKNNVGFLMRCDYDL